LRQQGIARFTYLQKSQRRKNMKRLLISTIAIVTVLFLVGCGKTAEGNGGGGSGGGGADPPTEYTLEFVENNWSSPFVWGTLTITDSQGNTPVFTLGASNDEIGAGIKHRLYTITPNEIITIDYDFSAVSDTFVTCNLTIGSYTKIGHHDASAGFNFHKSDLEITADGLLAVDITKQ
jgi:hypothetical protein